MSNTDKRKKISTTIGQYLKDLRTSRDLTQAQASELVGVSQPAIYYYENATRLPSTDVVTKYAKAFNKDVDSILRLREITIFETVELLGDDTPWQIKNERNMIAHGWRPGARDNYETKSDYLSDIPAIIGITSPDNLEPKNELKVKLSIDTSGNIKLNDQEVDIEDLDEILEKIRTEAISISKNKTER